MERLCDLVRKFAFLN
jgi:hypothetical protein